MFGMFEALDSVSTHIQSGISYEIKWSPPRKEIPYILLFGPKAEVVRFILSLYLMREYTFVMLTDIFCYFLSF